MNKFIKIIHENPVVRIFAYPYSMLKRVLMLNDYKMSKQGDRIAELKNRYSNKRCFIVGNGPSLKAKDLDKISGEYSFGANKIFYIFNETAWRPTFYTCGDKRLFEEIKEEIFRLDVPYVFLEYSLKLPYSPKDNMYRFLDYYPYRILHHKNYKPFVGEHLEKHYSGCYTVTFAAIQTAIYMGFKEIYLIGVDHDYSNIGGGNHFHKDSSDDVPPSESFLVTTRCYKAAKEYADSHGIRIYNATRGGKLDVFDRVDLDSLFVNDDEQNK